MCKYEGQRNNEISPLSNSWLHSSLAVCHLQQVLKRNGGAHHRSNVSGPLGNLRRSVRLRECTPTTIGQAGKGPHMTAMHISCELGLNDNDRSGELNLGNSELV